MRHKEIRMVIENGEDNLASIVQGWSDEKLVKFIISLQQKGKVPLYLSLELERRNQLLLTEGKENE